MPWTDAVMQSAATHIQGLATHAQVHSGNPGSDGTANVHTGVSRPAVDWSTPTGNGDFNLDAPIAFTGLPAGAPCPWLSFWSASSGGLHRGNYQVTSGDTVANAAGEFSVPSAAMNGNAT